MIIIICLSTISSFSFMSSVFLICKSATYSVLQTKQKSHPVEAFISFFFTNTIFYFFVIIVIIISNQLDHIIVKTVSLIYMYSFGYFPNFLESKIFS